MDHVTACHTRWIMPQNITHTVWIMLKQMSHSMQKQLTPIILIMLHHINHTAWIMLQNMSHNMASTATHNSHSTDRATTHRTAWIMHTSNAVCITHLPRTHKV